MQVVSQGAISAPMFSMKGPSMVQAKYPTAFPLKHQQKVNNLVQLSSERKYVEKRLISRVSFDCRISGLL